jgi:predicted SAM-dependent methyltransferase
MKINLGCGNNYIDGWLNHDDDVDITKRLPFDDDSAQFILAEHVVEHVKYNEALAFFTECRRVLKPGGVVRIAVPSIERIWRKGGEDYFRFVQSHGWTKTPDMRGAIWAMLNCHGHQAPWTASLLAVSLYLAGFDDVKPCDPGLSDHVELQGVEGHGRIIGDAFNRIETVICEGC